MAVVVRCTECRGASQVGAEALGMLVMCPRCEELFLALEEATPISRPAPKSPLPPAPRPRRRLIAEPVHQHVSSNPHDSSLPASSSLPVSVLFGFALLPLAIPLLWLIGPHVLAKPPALTLAAPASLAIAASVLCLAVVLTVDWAPLTRIKGVLILVGLSYFAGLSLYFLKRDVLEAVRTFFTPNERWSNFEPKDKPYRVEMPGRPHLMTGMPPPPLKAWALMYFQSSTGVLPGGGVNYVVGSGPDIKRSQGESWFDEVENAIVESAPAGTNHGAREEKKVFLGEARQWVLTLPEGNTRIVRVIRNAGNIYYQSVEGRDLEPEGQGVDRFFNSFRIGPPPGK